MADLNETPRKVSMAYILGFSKKPYKDVTPAAAPPPPPPPPSPPRSRKPSTLARMVTTPGGPIEWAASDGRKGALTGSAKPQLTAVALSKVPSEKRSTKDALGEKSSSKKTDSKKEGKDGGDPWGGGFENAGFVDTASKSGSKVSKSKKADANAGFSWDNNETNGGGIGGDANNLWENNNNTGGGGNDTWGNFEGGGGTIDPWGGGVATGGDDKNDEKKDDAVPDSHNAPAAKGNDDKKDDDSSGWTQDQDDKLMKLKSENANITWADIEKELGKAERLCKQRFGQIKPKDWRPPKGKGGGGDGGGGAGKKGKHKGNKNHNQGDNNKDGNKKEDNQEEVSGGDGINDIFGCFGPQSNEDKKDDTNKNAQHNQYTAAKPPSNKGASNNAGFEKTATQLNSAPASRPLELELKPDDVFSADDLRLVAKILQQDCSLVWNRLSWRFRDKTGRTLHPDVFEKKVTGVVEGKRDV